APVKLRAGELSEYELQAVRAGTGQPGRGVEWGSAVHAALEAVMRGMDGQELRTHLRGLLLAAERPVGPGGEPDELDELLGVVRAVRAAPLWQRARAADALQIETPFALALSGGEYASLASDIGAPVAQSDGEAPA